MSYILDALRRADAERQRGAVPGLHDQTGPLVADGATAAPMAARPGRPVLWWAGACAVLVLALGAAWWLGRGAAGVAPGALPGGPLTAAPGPMAQGPMAGAPVAVVPAALPATAPQAGAAPTTPAPPIGAPTTTAPPATLPPRLAPGTPPPVPPPLPSPRIVVPGPPPLPSQPPVVALLPGGRAAAGPPPAVAAAASDPVRPWASLPEATRAALPPLAWSGVVYAERAEQRLVVVNGQVAREGDVLGTGLQLLQIGPKSVLLRWQGQRIEMPL